MTNKIRVLVVDDSPSVRSALIKGLSGDPEIEVVGFARDGVEALEQLSKLKPDVVTLDVEMPHMNGVQALEKIMADSPTPVVMVSSLTGPGADITVQALQLGAVDFVLKKAARGSTAVRGLIEELLEKVHLAAKANVKAVSRPPSQQARVVPSERDPGWKPRVVAIASSTGGPQALRAVIPALPGDLDVPVLVVQHLPASFTARLAQSLNKISPLVVEEARPGLKVTPGRVLIAPGGVHMVVSKTGTIRLNLDDPECGVRPAANPMMESAAAKYGADTLGVVLTGMGSDGTRGAGLIKKAGGMVIAEDESTCVIYGMPRSVAQAGFVDSVVPLPDVASEVARLCEAREVAA